MKLLKWIRLDSSLPYHSASTEYDMSLCRLCLCTVSRLQVTYAVIARTGSRKALRSRIRPKDYWKRKVFMYHILVATFARGPGPGDWAEVPALRWYIRPPSYQDEPMYGVLFHD